MQDGNLSLNIAVVYFPSLNETILDFNVAYCFSILSSHYYFYLIVIVVAVVLVAIIFSDAFVKLPKVTISFIMSFSPSEYPFDDIEVGSQWTDFLEI